MLKNTRNSYGSLTRLLHWMMGFIVLGVMIAGFVMTSMENSDQKWFIYGQHKAFGVLILTLVPLRLIWRWINVQPHLPGTTPKWQATLAHTNILFLYVCMLLMPLSGFIMSSFGGHPISIFSLFTIEPFFQKHDLAGLAHSLHTSFAWAISISVSLHILGALHHHLIQRDAVLRRMVKGK